MSDVLHEKLNASIMQYQLIVQQLQAVGAALANDGQPLLERVQSLQQQQAAAQADDVLLLELLGQQPVAAALRPLLAQRLDLIAEVLELNRLLLPRINGMMSLISHELGDLQMGRRVLGGYKQSVQKQGRIVKSSV